MSGILNKKDRLLDFVITNNGRSQMQNLDIRYSYASLSDASIVYTKDYELSKLSKSNISRSNLDYIPLETTTFINNNNITNDDSLNPEFDLKNMFSYVNESILDLDSTSAEDIISNITFANASNEGSIALSLGQKLKNLKLLSDNLVIDKDKDIEFKDTGYINNNIDFNNRLNTYPTISDITKNGEDLPVIANDKKFSHKNNFKLLIPVDGNTKKQLYNLEQFSNINDLNEENTSGYMFKNIKLNNKTIKSNEVFQRDKEIIEIVRELENSREVYKKVYEIKNKNSDTSFIIEMFENEFLSASNTFLTKKLCILKIGEFYDHLEQKTKKVYQAGKIINTREDNKDLDILFNFNDSLNNLIGNKTFALSAYYSFVCMFTIVIE